MYAFWVLLATLTAFFAGASVQYVWEPTGSPVPGLILFGAMFMGITIVAVYFIGKDAR